MLIVIMDANSEPILIYCPFASLANARDTARIVVERKLAACVNLLPGLTSFYEWEGVLEESSEILLLAKTSKLCAAPLIELIGEIHNYEVPPIVVLPIVNGATSYLTWIEEQTKGG